MSTTTTVNFNLKTAGYANFANQTLTFRLLTAGADGTGDYVVLPGIVTATSDANGDGSVTLFRNGVSDIESIYEVILPNREKVQFVIPSGTATVELSSLIVNNQPTGATTQQSSVYAAAIQRANHTGTQPLSTISDASTVQLKPTEGAFVDGDKTKLDGIEAGATADQTSEEIQDIVGAMLTGNTETGITVTYQDSDGTIDFVVASQTDENFTTADHSKLDGIEASADVTDTANVTAAGALMDSEVDADIKTLVLPASTTISSYGKTLTDDASADEARATLGSVPINFVPNSISFNAATDNLSIADNAAIDVGTGDFTLSFFARLNTSADTHIFSKLSGTGYSIKFNTGSLILTMQDSGGAASFTLATGLNDDKWHTYVVTVDRNDTAIAYVDNVAQTGVDVSGTSGTLDNSGAFLIGNNNSVASSNLFALGYYIILHKSELSASAASQIYGSPDRGLTVAAPDLMVDLRRPDQTFKDISSNGLTVTTNNTITFNQDRLTEFTGTNVLATTTLGYTTGSGGTVTQSSSKTTGVTLNKINGEIVMNGAALADDATAAFTLTNSTIAATDVVIVNVASVGTAGAYQVTVGAVAAGSCSISVLNVSGGSLSEAIKLNFAVIKAVAS